MYRIIVEILSTHRDSIPDTNQCQGFTGPVSLQLYSSRRRKGESSSGQSLAQIHVVRDLQVPSSMGIEEYARRDSVPDTDLVLEYELPMAGKTLERPLVWTVGRFCVTTLPTPSLRSPRPAASLRPFGKSSDCRFLCPSYELVPNSG